MVGRVVASRGVALASVLALAAGPAAAHVGGGEATGFLAGLAHPFTGLDHALAMVAVGAWAAQSGRRASRALPAGFLVAMAAGAALAMSGLALPGVEVAIALSVLALGAAIAFAARPATWIAVALVAAFAVFHGHAHGGELLAGASALATASGFMLATATLHAIGLAGVALVARPAPRLARALGAAIALAGALLLAA